MKQKRLSEETDFLIRVMLEWEEELEQQHQEQVEIEQQPEHVEQEEQEKHEEQQEQEEEEVGPTTRSRRKRRIAEEEQGVEEEEKQPKPEEMGEISRVVSPPEIPESRRRRLETALPQQQPAVKPTIEEPPPKTAK